MSNELVRNMLSEQRKRLVATLMRTLETDVYPKLSRPEQEQLRRRTLDAIDRYHDVCLDLLKSSVQDGTAVNDEAIRLLVSLHGKLGQAVSSG